MIAPGRKSKCSSMSLRIVSSETLLVPNVSTLSEIGCAPPITYASCSSNRSASPALTMFFAMYRAASVPRVAAVRVDDDLASGEPGVAHRPADGERAGPVHQVLGLRVEPRAADGGPDDLLADLVAEALVIDARVMLRGDDDGVD